MRNHPIRLVVLFCVLLGGMATFIYMPASDAQATARKAAQPTTIRAIITARAHTPTRPKKAPADPCAGKTILNIVPHEDDDLLFINPSIQKAMNHGKCVRTVFLTAGEDGRSMPYMLSREQGAEAAYQVMAKHPLNWTHSVVTVHSKILTKSSPINDPELSLFFLRLPDGNLDGTGFPSTNYVSLLHLLNGTIGSLSSLDGGVTYTRQDLIDTLKSFIQTYKPVVINTLGTTTDGDTGADHADHLATGDFVNLAAKEAGVRYYSHTAHYRGYTIRGKSSNLTPAQTNQKAAAFFAYAHDDPGVCFTMEACNADDTSYGSYLSRQYSFTN